MEKVEQTKTEEVKKNICPWCGEEVVDCMEMSDCPEDAPAGGCNECKYETWLTDSNGDCWHSECVKKALSSMKVMAKSLTTAIEQNKELHRSQRNLLAPHTKAYNNANHPARKKRRKK